MKSTVLLYTQEFLTPSMTFIDRQIAGLEDEFNIKILTRKRSSQNLFAYQQVHCIKKPYIERIYNRAFRRYGLDLIPRSQYQSEQIVSLIEKLEPRFIHAHFGPAALEILPIARKLQIPLLTTLHGYDASSLLRFQNYRTEFKQLLEYSKIITVSKFMERDLRRNFAKIGDVQCVHIGIPLDIFSSKIDRETIESKVKSLTELNFLQVSNFVEKKGHVFSIFAFKQFLSVYENAHLNLVGSGPLLEKIRRLTVKLGIQKHVTFHGHQNSESVSEMMQEADCFLHHSITSKNGDKEGIPTVLMEAMATGLPCISTYHAGIPELIQHGKNGYLVHERDVEAYVLAFKHILKDNGHIGMAAKETIMHDFNIKTQNKVLGRIYESFD